MAAMVQKQTRTPKDNLHGMTLHRIPILQVFDPTLAPVLVYIDHKCDEAGLTQTIRDAFAEAGVLFRELKERLEASGLLRPGGDRTLETGDEIVRKFLVGDGAEKRKLDGEGWVGVQGVQDPDYLQYKHRHARGYMQWTIATMELYLGGKYLEETPILFFYGDLDDADPGAERQPFLQLNRLSPHIGGDLCKKDPRPFMYTIPRQHIAGRHDDDGKTGASGDTESDIGLKPRVKLRNAVIDTSDEMEIPGVLVLCWDVFQANKNCIRGIDNLETLKTIPQADYADPHTVQEATHVFLAGTILHELFHAVTKMSGGTLLASASLSRLIEKETAGRVATKTEELPELTSALQCASRAVEPVEAWYTIDQPESYIAVATSSYIQKHGDRTPVKARDRPAANMDEDGEAVARFAVKYGQRKKVVYDFLEEEESYLGSEGESSSDEGPMIGGGLNGKSSNKVMNSRRLVRVDGGGYD